MAANPAPRALMKENTFLENFDNRAYPHKTYLCYEVEHIRDDNTTVEVSKGFLRNEGADIVLYRRQRRHAEPIFLGRMSYWTMDTNLRYRVTCFISWSPCKACAKKLAAFVRENRHVALCIFAARIYENSRGFKAGLRALKAAGAKVAMMTSKEFEHCWATFVNHRNKSFPPWDDLDAQSEQLSQKLEGILQN